jgi:hypothetical protein
MTLRQKLLREARVVLVATLYFGICFGVLMALKRLYLADYEVKFRGLSLAVVSALVVAKVVLLMEHVTLGKWVRERAVIIDVLLRTLLCSVGVFVVVLLEKGFEGRHEHGGFGPAVVWICQHRDMNHVWADTIAIAGALLGFNALGAVRRHLGEGRLHRLFLAPAAGEVKARPDQDDLES